MSFEAFSAKWITLATFLQSLFHDSDGSGSAISRVVRYDNRDDGACVTAWVRDDECWG